MRKLYLQNHFWRICLLLSSLVGCHQEPLVPKSAIPHTCQLYKLININEGIRDTTTYAYNDFGNIETSTYRKWIDGQLINSVDQSFSYTSDHYLSSQIERTSIRAANGVRTQESRGYQYAYQNGRIQEVKITNNEFGATLGFRQYTYEGENLRTYSETSSNRAIIKRYTFDGSGKLTNLEEPASTIYTIISNGKITQKSYPDSTYVKYEFDPQGQLVKLTNFSASGRSQYTYTYDTNPYWTKTQLRLRGIPNPDLGENIQIHNLKSYSYQLYQNNGQPGAQKIITYNHAYNNDGYSKGYGRSDGTRQVSIYTNCP